MPSFNLFPCAARRSAGALDRMRASALGLSLLFAMAVVGGASAQRSEGAATTCYKRESHVEQIGCLAELERKAQADMVAAEQALLGSIRASSEDPSTIQRVTQQLEKAFVEYQTYRTTHCDAIAALALGGNAAPDRRMLCHIELDTRRVADLKAEGHGV